MTKKEFITIDTKKATKNTLLDALKSLPKSVKDTNLLERVQYTLAQAEKSLKNVTVSDLKELVVEAQSLLTPAPAAPVPVEAAKKPVSKKSKEPVEEDTDDDDDAEEEDEPAPAPKKSKKGLKKPSMKTSKPKTKASGELPIASMFPTEIPFETDEGEVTLVAVPNKYHSVQEIRDALDEGKTLFIAGYWTKRHLKQYEYAEQFHITGNMPKAFPNDLDILNIVITCDTMERVWAMSTYTEAMYRFDKPQFEPVEDEDENGDKFYVRVCNGMEFELYEPAE